jgi:hypothetical protein
MVIKSRASYIEPCTKAAPPPPNQEDHKKRIILQGEVSSAIHPRGCRFSSEMS